MFFFLARVVIGKHLYWHFFDLTIHGEVLLVTWNTFTLLWVLLSLVHQKK